PPRPSSLHIPWRPKLCALHVRRDPTLRTVVTEVMTGTKRGAMAVAPVRMDEDVSGVFPIGNYDVRGLVRPGGIRHNLIISQEAQAAGDGVHLIAPGGSDR